MTVQQQMIADYLSNVTHGVLNIKAKHAEMLINLAKDRSAAYVIKQRFNGQNTTYENVQVIHTNDADILAKWQVANLTPLRGFYCFQCFYSDGQQALIYSANPNLFQW